MTRSAVGRDMVRDATWIQPVGMQAHAVGPRSCGCSSREPDRAHAQRRLLRWFTEIADHEVPELMRLARTIDAWREELLA